MRKKLLTMALAGLMALFMVSASFAGQWKQDSAGYWYQNEDGSYPSNGWQWVDGNNDGTAECYYFDANGYMLANTTTPDNYQVNGEGAWVVNGVVQTQTVQQPQGNQQSNPSETIDIKSAGYTDGISNIALELLTASRADLIAKYGPETVVTDWRGIKDYQYQNLPQFKLRYNVYADDTADTWKRGAELIAGGGSTCVFAVPANILENVSGSMSKDELLNWAHERGYIKVGGLGYHKMENSELLRDLTIILDNNDESSVYNIRLEK